VLEKGGVGHGRPQDRAQPFGRGTGSARSSGPTEWEDGTLLVPSLGHNSKLLRNTGHV
jgi:hypothetical protein